MSDVLVNYVWINKEPVKTGDAPVPFLSLERAFKNARQYPDAPFLVWVDENGLCEQGRKSLREIFNAHAPDNMLLRDLNEIPFYRSCDLFSGDKACIWGKVDLARLVVLEHCLLTMPYQTVIYSDFDAEDVALNNSEVVRRLDQYGMVFGASPEDYLENGYIGFDKANTSFLIENIIPMTMIRVSTGDDGYVALMAALKEWAEDKNCNKYDLAVELLPARGYKMQGTPKLDYSRFGISTAEPFSPVSL